MDPNKTWQEIVSVLNQAEKSGSDVDELKTHLSNLYRWIKRGGFRPKELESLNDTGCSFLLNSIFRELSRNS